VFWAGSTHANRATASFRVTAGGALTATGATISGAITATSGSFTGAIDANSGTLGALTVDGTLTIGTGGSIVSGATNYSTGTGIFLGLDGATHKMRIGTTAGNRLTWDGTTLTIAGSGAGITSIDGGNITTGTVTATQIAANTITAAKIAAGTITATEIASDTITATQIAANAITASEIATGAVTAIKISVTNLAAVSASMGALTVDNTLTMATGGVLKSGATAYNSGTGYWLEHNAGAPRFFIGNSAGNKLTWDGSALSITGAITATSGTFTGEINASSGSITGALTMGASGKINIDSGNAVLDSAGIKLATGSSDGSGSRALQFWSSAAEAAAGTGSVLSYISAATSSSNHNLYLRSLGGTTASIKIQAATGAGGNAYIYLKDNVTDASIAMYASTLTFNNSAVLTAASSVDADYLDGAASSAFGQLATAASWSAIQTFNGGLRIGGDPGAGSSGKVSLTNATSGTSTGYGTVKMGGATYRDSTGWLKIYVAGNAKYIPYWDAV
jgi:hypothetical protein